MHPTYKDITDENETRIKLRKRCKTLPSPILFSFANVVSKVLLETKENISLEVPSHWNGSGQTNLIKM